MRLGRDQPVADLLEHFLVAGALFTAVILDREAHDVVHLGHDVDLALQLLRRVEEDPGGVRIAAVDGGVHRQPDRPPLPRHGVVAALIEIDVDPLRVHIAEIGHLVRLRLHQEAFADPDRHISAGRNDHVEPVTARLHLGQRGIVAVIVGDGDFDAGLGGELLDQLGVGVVAPVVDVQLARGGGRNSQRGRQPDCGKQRSHFPIPCLGFPLFDRR